MGAAGACGNGHVLLLGSIDGLIDLPETQAIIRARRLPSSGPIRFVWEVRWRRRLQRGWREGTCPLSVRAHVHVVTRPAHATRRRGALARAVHRTSSRCLGTPAGGLSTSQAAERLAVAGPNVTGGSGGERWMTLLLRQVANPLIVVLLVSGAVAIALGDLVDGAVVLRAWWRTR